MLLWWAGHGGAYSYAHRTQEGPLAGDEARARLFASRALEESRHFGPLYSAAKAAVCSSVRSERSVAIYCDDASWSGHF